MVGREKGGNGDYVAEDVGESFDDLSWLGEWRKEEGATAYNVQNGYRLSSPPDSATQDRRCRCYGEDFPDL